MARTNERSVLTSARAVTTLNLVVVYRLLNTAEYSTIFGAAALRAQVDLRLHSFRYDYGFVLIIFGIHLCLLGYLMFRSGYTGWISKAVGGCSSFPALAGSSTS